MSQTIPEEEEDGEKNTQEKEDNKDDSDASFPDSPVLENALQSDSTLFNREVTVTGGGE